MNLTSLNKIVTLLVSGVLTELLLVLWWVNQGLDFANPPTWWHEIAEPMLQREFMASVILGSLTVFCGMLTQSCGEFLLYHLNPNQWPAWLYKFFALSESLEAEQTQRAAAMEAMSNHAGYPLRNPVRSKSDPGCGLVPIMFHRSPVVSVQWGTEHYAVALLASNFIVITLLASLPFREIWFFWLLLPCILWLLIWTVACKKLYAFEIASAEAALVLWDELQARQNAGAEKRPANGDSPQLRSSYHVT